MKPIKNWNDLQNEKKLIVVKDKFNVAGIDIVVSGVINFGVITIGDKLKIVPFIGIYVDIIINSMHDNF